MRVQEARKPRPQLGRHRRAGGVDAQQAGRGGAELSLQQALPGLGQGHAAGGAMEQAHPQPSLQRADRVAHRRGRKPQLGAGTAEAAVTGDRRERGKVG
ncbi:hypothetical protein G6F22_012748 [Rhizopus arrhizus]|nr:hypothetical protein G6F22_012748 [Rhizopus arrhizus]